MSINGVRDDRMVLSAFVQQLEEKKAYIEKTMGKVKANIEETNKEEKNFRKVI